MRLLQLNAGQPVIRRRSCLTGRCLGVAGYCIDSCRFSAATFPVAVFSLRVLAMSTNTRAKVEDLYHIPDNGKAEIVNGELIRMLPTGGKQGRAGGKIFVALDRYERETRTGYAFPDNVGFIVHLPGRDSFSPDAAFYAGGEITAKFLEGAPVFAVEVRSENDYGARAERKIALKIVITSPPGLSLFGMSMC